MVSRMIHEMFHNVKNLSSVTDENQEYFHTRENTSKCEDQIYHIVTCRQINLQQFTYLLQLAPCPAKQKNIRLRLHIKRSQATERKRILHYGSPIDETKYNYGMLLPFAYAQHSK